MNEFEPLQPLRVRDTEEQDKEIWQPRWNCFCCQDTGKVQPDLVRRVIPSYDYDRDRIPMCQNCDKGQLYWGHLNQLGVIDQRLTFQICRKLDAISRKDWKCTTRALFELVLKRLEEGTTEVSQKYNLRRRDRIQEEFILIQRNHGKARGDWENIPEKKVEDELHE